MQRLIQSAAIILLIAACQPAAVLPEETVLPPTQTDLPPTPTPTATSTALPATAIQSTQGAPASCAEVDQNPPELTFELAYCLGSLCMAQSEAECVAVDVLGSEGIVSGSDGWPDCAWHADEEPLNACRPNR